MRVHAVVAEPCTPFELPDGCLWALLRSHLPRFHVACRRQDGEGHFVSPRKKATKRSADESACTASSAPVAAAAKGKFEYHIVSQLSHMQAYEYVVGGVQGFGNNNNIEHPTTRAHP
jgi:hypothetical protein